MTKIISFKDKVEGGSRGVPIGDALGLPFENMKSAAIADTFGVVKEYLPVRNHKKITEYVEQKKGYAPINLDNSGVISDDAILTLAGMNSVIEKGEIDIINLFGRHKKMHQLYGGYGFSELVDNKLTKYDGSNDLSALKDKNTSFGNGVMMKQFPYAAYFHTIKNDNVPLDYVDNTIAEITSITHNTPISKLVSIMHNKTLMYLLSSQPDELDMKGHLKHLQFIAPFHERMNGADNSSETHMTISPILDKLLCQIDEINNGNPYSYEKILDTYLIEFADPKMNKGMKRGYHVASTFGIVYALFLQNQNFQGLIDAIQIGYDTDSQASILGSMVGALKGPFYNQKYIDGLEKRDDIARTITDFQKVLGN